MPQNFVEKPFADGSQTSKFTKVFSLESFPLYGIMAFGTHPQCQCNSAHTHNKNATKNINHMDLVGLGCQQDKQALADGECVGGACIVR